MSVHANVIMPDLHDINQRIVIEESPGKGFIESDIVAGPLMLRYQDFKQDRILSHDPL